MFWKKETKAELSPLEITHTVLGDTSGIISPMSCETALKYPFLSHYGANTECDYCVNGTIGELSFEFSYPLKVYSTERSKKYHHYSFIGNCLTIRHPGITLKKTYSFSGKPFCPPSDDLWVKGSKFKGVSIFSFGTELSDSELNTVKCLIAWIESGLSAILSARYAIFTNAGTANIVFWEPELYDLESQLMILKEKMLQY